MEIDPIDYCEVIFGLLLIFIAVLWLWISCKVPLNFWDPSVTPAHRMTVVYLYWHLIFSAPGASLAIIKVLLPKTLIPWAIVDFATGSCFLIARYVPRIYFSAQLCILLDNVVPKATLVACKFVAYFFMISQAIILSWDFILLKYGSLDIILSNGIVPDSVPLLDFQISMSVTILLIVCTLILDTIQLYLFYQGTKLLHHDTNRKRALSIVLLSFILSTISVTVCGIGPFIHLRDASSYFAFLFYPVEPSVISMPFIVKRYKRLDILVKWIVAVIDERYQRKLIAKSLNLERLNQQRNMDNSIY